MQFQEKSNKNEKKEAEEGEKEVQSGTLSVDLLCEFTSMRHA